MNTEINTIIGKCTAVFAEKESHSNWDKYLNKVKYLTTSFQKTPSIFECSTATQSIMSIKGAIESSIITDRTTLSVAAGGLVSVLVNNLKERFQPLVSSFVPALIKVLGRSNKILRESSYKALGSIVDASPFKNLLEYFIFSLDDNNLQVRRFSITLVDLFIFKWDPVILKGFQIQIEKCIVLGLKDKDLIVRCVSKHSYQSYLFKCPDRENLLNKQLTPDVLKGIRTTPYPSLSFNLLRPVQKFQRVSNIEQIQVQALKPIQRPSLIRQKQPNETRQLLKINKPLPLATNLKQQAAKPQLPGVKPSNQPLKTQKQVSKPSEKSINTRQQTSRPSIKPMNSQQKVAKPLQQVKPIATKPKSQKKVISYPIPDYSWVKPKVDCRRPFKKCESAPSGRRSLSRPSHNPPSFIIGNNFRKPSHDNSVNSAPSPNTGSFNARSKRPATSFDLDKSSRFKKV